MLNPKLKKFFCEKNNLFFLLQNGQTKSCFVRNTLHLLTIILVPVGLKMKNINYKNVYYFRCLIAFVKSYIVRTFVKVFDVG